MQQYNVIIYGRLKKKKCNVHLCQKATLQFIIKLLYIHIHISIALQEHKLKYIYIF
jgi:gamma-glutamylcyclotransferase (GGCT)/AIG2-like uncharacterized protein YtfP